ncbi:MULTISPECIES: sporulation protein YqfD [unclassified Bacillus (in: firmicutes)]|uniref:sporulation protein YqfD n=1 Tax=unclassified Bacillus (in: firmicutes) TaxID=185979 RepID=UPI0008E544F6|nr:MULTISPECIES: sporulation protein YqfD [unclassified Bacillus (in: firmicutes)]SFA95635.1 similar to stage IV sporulation protein [Bacillus sp. UNCCL13]SFQ79236.1 similar to stage IV sporulation protein [Bacillus sp. cl95]
MKNQWIEFFNGTVTVKAKGKGCERFINNITREGLNIWNVKRYGPEAVVFNMRLQDIKVLRGIVRKSECKVEFLKRDGAPFLMKRLLKNSGFLIGAIAFLSIIILLSNVVWGIEIKGAKPATEYQIRKELDKMGVKIGSVQFFIDDVESIQRKLTNNIEELTWVGVELQGTTFHFQVVEKNQPKQPELLTPRNLVAKKEAVIVNLFVEKGQPVVKVHDFVQKGQLLVSGLMGKEGQMEVVASKAEVLGETWYKTYVELPLNSTFSVYSGKEKRKHAILIGDWSIPIWGFGDHQFAKYKEEVNVKKIKFMKWELPIAYVHKTIREREDVTRSYSKEEAIGIAREMARNDIKKQLSEEAIIKDDKILQRVFDNGKVKLTVHFQIIENIAEGQPIVQGDE